MVFNEKSNGAKYRKHKISKVFQNAIFSLPFYFLSSLIFAFPSATKIETQADREIKKFYSQSQTIRQQPLSLRLVFIAQQFLGKPYKLGALGEGVRGYFDQYPLYRVDSFDCETYVDTVLALALGHDLNSFKHYIRQIRYHRGKIAFIKRNHFISLDWNPHNQKQGFIRDITAEILEKIQSAKPLMAQALIDKPRWYQKISSQRVRFAHATFKEKQRRIDKLKQQGAACSSEYAQILYIPFDVLFDKQNRPNQKLFAHIPQGAILEIVRPNWDLTSVIGTHLNVSHLGFVLREKNKLYFLQASSMTHQVSKAPLIDYLREAQKSPTIRGINLQIAVSQLGNRLLSKLPAKGDLRGEN